MNQKEMPGAVAATGQAEVFPKSNNFSFDCQISIDKNSNLNNLPASHFCEVLTGPWGHPSPGEAFSRGDHEKNNNT